MRARVLLKFAKILMISRLRGTRRSFVTNSITARPVIIALIGIGLFVFGLGLGWVTISVLTSSSTDATAVAQIVFTIFGHSDLPDRVLLLDGTAVGAERV